MDRPWRLQLANLGRRHHVSQSGLAALLKELHETGGELPSTLSRQSIKRARAEAVSQETPHGQIIQSMTIAIGSAPGTVDVTYIDPAAMLWYASKHCQHFSTRLRKLILDTKPTIAAPWRIVLYSDEVALCQN